MAELKDIIEELVNKTKGGQLKWSNYQNQFWILTHQNCNFTVFQNGPVSETMTITWNSATSSQSQNHDDKETISPLFDLLNQLYPPQKVNPEEGLKIALDCLQHE